MEAELSEEGEEGVSSDEDDGEELNRSLEGFVVGNTQCSQGLNGGTSLWLLVKKCINSLDWINLFTLWPCLPPPAGRL